jgi:hypothetical protein
MAHTPRVLTLPEVGEASAELVSDDFPVLHVATRFQAKSVYEQMKRKGSKRKAVRINYTDRCDEGNLVQPTHERGVMPNIC